MRKFVIIIILLLLALIAVIATGYVNLTQSAVNDHVTSTQGGQP